MDDMEYIDNLGTLIRKLVASVTALPDDPVKTIALTQLNRMV